MAKKVLLALLFLALLANSTSAAITVTDINFGLALRGAGFITTDTNISFTLNDDNTVQQHGVDYNVTIRYQSVTAGTYKSVVVDLNLGDANTAFGKGYCDQNITHVLTGEVGVARCQYTWTDANISGQTDGNYLIDINVVHLIEAGNFTLYDGNTLDTNSFYIDNIIPACSLEKGRGNQFTWILNEIDAESAGSTTTFYTSVVDSGRATNYTSTSGKFGNRQTGTYSSGKKDYQCYATDSAGNVGNTSLKYTIQYPPEGAEVVIQTTGGGGITGSSGVLQATAGIPVVGDAVAFAQANPLFAIIAVGAAILLLSGGKKKKRRR